MTVANPQKFADLDIRNHVLPPEPAPEVDPKLFTRKIQQYRTLSPITHDGKTIPVGALLDLPRSEAEPLLALGAIELITRSFDSKIDVSVSVV